MRSSNIGRSGAYPRGEEESRENEPARLGRKDGGRISSENAPMGPKLPGGARGGLARLAKAHRAARGK